MQIIRRSSFTATPWKNGGGITHEVIRVPAQAASYRWRLSIAQIDASGPFSDFAGYRRTMVLLRGSGVRLNFGGAHAVSLTRVGALVEFDGALKTDCRLLDGPCADLNLMVSRSVRNVGARVEHVAERRVVPGAIQAMPAMAERREVPRVVQAMPAVAERRMGSRGKPASVPAPHGITLVLSILGALTLENEAGPPVVLEPWDLAILPVGVGSSVATVPGQAGSSLVFFATLDDNPS